MSDQPIRGSEFQDELDRRLEVLTAPDYDEPARHNLTWADYAGLIALVVVLTVVFLVWGY